MIDRIGIESKMSAALSNEVVPLINNKQCQAMLIAQAKKNE